MKSPELDHLGFACRNLEALLKIFKSLGFAPTKPEALYGLDDGGQRIPLGQISAHIVLGHTYIELSAVPDQSTGNHLEPFLSRHEGLHILALRADDIEFAHQRACQANKHPSKLQTATREIAYGERHGRAKFRWWMLPSRDIPDGLVCYVDNQRPDLVYQAAVQNHPNTALDISAVLIRAEEPAESMARWLPITMQTQTDSEYCIELPNARLVFSRDEHVDLPPPPCLAGLEVTVPELTVINKLIANEDWEILQQTAARLSLRLPAPANVVLAFRKASAKSSMNSGNLMP